MKNIVGLSSALCLPFLFSLETSRPNVEHTSISLRENKGSNILQSKWLWCLHSSDSMFISSFEMIFLKSFRDMIIDSSWIQSIIASWRIADWDEVNCPIPRAIIEEHFWKSELTISFIIPSKNVDFPNDWDILLQSATTSWRLLSSSTQSVNLLLSIIRLDTLVEVFRSWVRPVLRFVFTVVHSSSAIPAPPFTDYTWVRWVSTIV